MEVQELITLLMVELKDDIVGMISHEGNVITVEFGNGITRTISVK